ncbi:hypothetical protein UA08_07496 [Talaromyces atroroseus]|uniref:Uncharacterized protein n=1 Tax=Talaromyces atroroseus TaxID=1441469 RepID=A0A225A9B8_TALAT|nr:hypothetical protein UA08_07496 [Talaromyces atroroseus]OKL57312.1 hypothetical protein UA08_07496 [Talaromyces atroroseus]
METVLVVGATGNIGVAAVLGVLRAKRNVLAVVRNQASADKLFQHVKSKDGITIVEADIMAEEGVRGVVDQVRAGKLPAFQHVYAAAGGAYGATLLRDLTTSELRKFMAINFESNFPYRASIPYLLEQSGPTSFTLCTGSQGDIGARAAPAITQGPLFSMANVACRDNENTNVRFNEVYLQTRVEVDSSAEKTGAMKASDFAHVYTELLSRPDIKSCRISVATKNDLTDLKYKKKITC